MSKNLEVQRLLVGWHNRITPAAAGLPEDGKRRVVGLRREEVAELAGVSLSYYIRMERGNLSGVSDSVLNALARALQLTQTERLHLFNLAYATRQRAGQGTAAGVPDDHGLWELVSRISGVGVIATNALSDILAANDLARRLFPDLWDDPSQPGNVLRYLFLDPRAHVSFGNWEQISESAVAALRLVVGKRPYDRDLSELVAQLQKSSPGFSSLWERNLVAAHNRGTKLLNHPKFGQLEVQFHVFAAPAVPGISLTTYQPTAASETIWRRIAG